MIKRLKCLTNSHSVNRRRVWHDGHNYRTRCSACATPLIRSFGEWRKFDVQRDAEDSRKMHPTTGEAV